MAQSKKAKKATPKNKRATVKNPFKSKNYNYKEACEGIMKSLEGSVEFEANLNDQTKGPKVLMACLMEKDKKRGNKFPVALMEIDAASEMELNLSMYKVAQSLNNAPRVLTAFLCASAAVDEGGKKKEEFPDGIAFITSMDNDGKMESRYFVYEKNGSKHVIVPISKKHPTRSVIEKSQLGVVPLTSFWQIYKAFDSIKELSMETVENYSRGRKTKLDK